jgi:hypothetical protein
MQKITPFLWFGLDGRCRPESQSTARDGSPLWPIILRLNALTSAYQSLQRGL